MRTVKILSLVCILIFLFCACTNTAEEPTSPSAAGQSTVPETTAALQTTAAPPAQTESPSQPEETEPSTDALLSLPDKSGNMIFSDDPSNRYIQAVVQKYGTDAALLAAIYTEPAADTNMVWEFDGTVNADGKLIRNADTLKYVYTVTADCSGITRAGGLRNNDGISAAGGYFLMQSTKQLILPEYREQLEG